MIRKALFALAALALGSSAALALPNGVVVSKDGRTVTVPHGVASYVHPGMHVPKGGKMLFSNIGYDYPKGLYFCCYGGTISGPTSALGFSNWIGVAFTPANTGKITEIELGVGYVEGTATANIGIWSDSGGVPGTEIKGADEALTQTYGGCCTTVTFKHKVAVTGGTQYWVVVSTDSNNSDLFGAWNFNSTDEVDGLTTSEDYNGEGWGTAGSYVPGFNLTIYGK